LDKVYKFVGCRFLRSHLCDSLSLGRDTALEAVWDLHVMQPILRISIVYKLIVAS